MDFIERVFNISPDGGSGSAEVAYLVAICVVVWVWAYREPIRRALQWRPRRWN
jgi:hypothetical protein